MTETLVSSSASTPTREANTPLRGIRSAQKETVRYDNVTFGQFLSAFNPLRHIPVVSNLFAVEPEANPIAPMAQLIGGGLLGGLVGIAGAITNLAFEEATGKGLVGSIVDGVEGKKAAQRYVSIADAHKHKPEMWTA